MASNDFLAWLATQPTFVEVTVGAFFCLLVAPAVLAGAAMAVTALEALAEKCLKRLLASRRTHAPSHYPALLRP